jgi:hypothetical protein
MEKRKRMKSKIGFPQAEKIVLPGYPIYPANEDIYSQSIEEENIDPEDITKFKEGFKIDKTEKRNEQGFGDAISGSDLDIPGSELDDQMEQIGSEDEENNAYSLGSDLHNDLEEDKG